MRRQIGVLLCSAFLAVFPMAVLGAAQTPEEPTRIVVIGDIHGDFDRFEGILLDAELIDKRHNWVGGETTLVQLGDVTDRGPDSRKIVELLMKLETRAARRGGVVHALIGNHEAMNVTGDLRYVHAGEYEAFVTSKSRAGQDRYYQRYKAYMRENSPEGELMVFDDDHREEWNKTYPLGFVEHRRAWSSKGKYGKWVRERDAVVKLGTFLFVHGGIGPTYAQLPSEEINTLVRLDLDEDTSNDSNITTATDGPLWYRGLASHPEELELPNLEQLLATHEVSHIVVGHTPLTEAIVPRFGARVIVADVGLSEYYGRANAYLEIVDDQMFAIHRGQRVALPSTDTEALKAYFQTVRDLEEQANRLDAYMAELFSEGEEPDSVP